MFSDRIKLARKERGLTQIELATSSGLQSSAIGHIEAGRREPNLANIRKLATSLNVSADWLLELPSNGFEEGFQNGAIKAVELMNDATLCIRKSP